MADAWAQHSWALTGLALALLVLLVLPTAQIELGAKQLHGLIGSYTAPGSYSVAYTGGTTTVNGGTPTNYGPSTFQSAPGDWGGGANTYFTTSGGSLTCAGQITATFTWNGGAGNVPAPPAGSVIVTETANAAWNGPGSTGSCGLPNYTTSAYAPNQTGVRYSVHGGPSFSVTASPTASASGAASSPYSPLSAAVFVGYKATASVPVSVISVTGDSTVDTAGWDASHPRFFSGTNCKATGTGAASAGHIIAHALLVVGTTVVKEYDDTGASPLNPGGQSIYVTGTNQSNVTLSVNFDSTNFQNNTNIPIQMLIYDSAFPGNPFFGKTSANAFNQAYVLGNDVQDVGSLTEGRNNAKNASGWFNASNTSATGYYMRDDKPTILNNLPQSTGFFVYSHGSAFPSVFGDCFVSSTGPPSNMLAANDTSIADGFGPKTVTVAVGQKTMAQPPYNFVVIDACDIANSGDMAQAFGITPSSIDLSFFGFTTLVADYPHNTAWTNQMLTDMSKGYTIAAAIADATFQVGTPQYQDNYLHWQTATPYAWGDNATKLHGVYGGTGTQWFK